MPNFDVSSEYVKCASVNIRFFLVLVFLDWFCESTICEKVLFLYFFFCFFLFFLFSQSFATILYNQICFTKHRHSPIITVHNLQHSPSSTFTRSVYWFFIFIYFSSTPCRFLIFAYFQFFSTTAL